MRGRIDWKYALGLSLIDPGFDHTVLSEFRSHLVEGKAEQLLLDMLVKCLQEHDLVKARGRQRTHSTYVLADVRKLNRLERVGETMPLNELVMIARRLLAGDKTDRAGLVASAGAGRMVTNGIADAWRTIACPRPTPRGLSMLRSSARTAVSYWPRLMPPTSSHGRRSCPRCKYYGGSGGNNTSRTPGCCDVDPKWKCQHPRAKSPRPTIPPLGTTGAKKPSGVDGSTVSLGPSR